MSRKEKKNEEEVYFLGSDSDIKKENKKSNRNRFILIAGCIALLVILIFLILTHERATDYYFEPETIQSVAEDSSIVNSVDKSLSGYVEVLEETVNDVPLFIYIPHNSVMSLAVGPQEKGDSSIVFIAQAADIRADNMDIVGDFVLKGKRLSRGKAKTGYCAVINNNITIGVGEDTPLLQAAMDNKGYFFRQYPLVADGNLIVNNIKNKAIRRAIAIRQGRVVMAESRSAESFHDFSQALIDSGINDAIYLVGSNAYGWYYNKTRDRLEFGVEKAECPDNTNYIVWRTNESK